MPQQAPPVSPTPFEELPMVWDRGEAARSLLDVGPVVTFSDGVYAAVSKSAVEYVFRHPEVFSSTVIPASLGTEDRLVPLGYDPPEHTTLRRILFPYFRQSAIASLEPALRDQVNLLIDGFIETGECDVVTDMARPFPTRVFLTFFGLPPADADLLKGWNEAITDEATAASAAAASETVQAVTGKVFAYIDSQLERRRAEGADTTGSDVLSRLLAEQKDGGLTDEQIRSLCYVFFLGGLDTVTSVISSSFAALAQRPQLQRRIGDDPAIIPRAVEEFVRSEPPAPFLPRLATSDTVVEGYRIPAGSVVMVALTAANRDLAEEARPHVIDFDRDNARHLGFGHGAHYCLGVHLARLELRVLLEEWHRRIPEYTLRAGHRPGIGWPAGTMGFTSIPLVFPPGGRAHSR